MLWSRSGRCLRDDGYPAVPGSLIGIATAQCLGYAGSGCELRTGEFIYDEWQAPA